MEGNNNRNIIIVVAALGVVLVFLTVWLLTYKKSGVSLSGNEIAPTAVAPQSDLAPSLTRQSAPSEVSVPNATSSDVPANVAKPNLVAPAGPNTSASLRKFSISVGGNQFTPSTVIVNIGDTVHLDITAVDNSYDFAQPDYGFSVSLPKGQAKVVEFQATAGGKFTFYCKSCGGPAKGPLGYIIVAPK